MPWRVVISDRAERDLLKLDLSLRELILARIRQAGQDPSSAGLAKLQGRPPRWRIRIGDWRVLLTLDTRTGQMTVSRVLNRRDAYR